MVLDYTQGHYAFLLITLSVEEVDIQSAARR
jgi:hypothetical protein